MSTQLPEYVAPETMDVLYSRETIDERVRAIGEEISKEYEGKSIVLIGVLKGAAIFLADLARAIDVDNTFDFVAVSSYGRARVSSGAVKLIKDIDNPIEGKHVIIVEDILDTGLTLSYLRGLMLQHKPASLKIATCLDKPARRLVPLRPTTSPSRSPTTSSSATAWTTLSATAALRTSASSPKRQPATLSEHFHLSLSSFRV